MSEPTAGGESGFEIARAFVAVDPDASDFAQALDEQVGGISVAVRVTPNAADFQEQLDEQIGTPTAVVRVSADTSPAEGEVESLLSGMDEQTGVLSVSADTGLARSKAEALAEDISGFSADLSVGADTGGAGEGAEALAEQLGAVQDAAEGADEAVSATSGKMAELQAAAERAEISVQGLTGAFGDYTSTVTEQAGMGAAFGDTLAQRLGEGIAGGITVPVQPDLSKFADAIAEAAQGVTVTVSVTPLLSDFVDTLTERTDGLSVPVRVVPLLEDFAEELAEAAGGVTLTVMTEPDAAGFQERLTEQAGDLTESALVDPDATGFQEKLDEQVGTPVITVTADLDPAGLEAADATLKKIGSDADYAAQEMEFLQQRAEALSGSLSGSGASAGLGEIVSEAGDVVDATATARGALADLVEAETTAASTTRTVMAGMFVSAQDAIDGNAKAIYALGGQYESMGNALGDAQAPFTGMNQTLRGITEDAGDAEKATSGFSGILGTLSERMSYMAVDPFLWMLAVPALVGGVEDALSRYNSMNNQVLDSMARQDQATGFNISGYQKLAGQLKDTGGANTAYKMTVDDVNHSYSLVPVSGLSFIDNLFHVHSAADEAAQSAADLRTHLGSLEQQFSLTRTQAEDLARAAGVSAKQLAGTGGAANTAMDKIEAYARANIGAEGPVGQITQDMVTYSNDTLTAADRTGALNDAFDRLVGNFVSSQQDMLQVQQDFLTIGSNASQAGASMNGTNQASVTLQQSFYSTIPAIEQIADAMVKQGDSTQQVNAYIDSQIVKLSGLTGGNQQAQQAVEGLKQWEDNLTNSVGEGTNALSKAADTLQTQFTKQIQDAGDKSKTTKTAVDNLTLSIIGTGKGSTTSEAARAQLIKDLEQSGIKAQTATGLVDAYIKKIAAIPSSKTLSLTETATGQWSIHEMTAATDPYGSLQAKTASGWLVSGGTPGRDSVPILAMPGELVVPTDMVNAGAVDHLRGKIPGFGTGGMVGGSYSGGLPGAASFLGTEYADTQDMLTAELEQAVSQAIASAKAKAVTAAGAGGGAGGAGNATGSGASVESLAKSMAAARGWTGAEWTALDEVEMREAGWSMTAQNPSSGAYGIAQFINGPSEYATYGGNSSTAAGQVTAFLNYIAQRYGSPIAAEEHEVQYGWYQNGGYLPPGGYGVVGEAGPELIQGGRTGATVTPIGGGQAPVINVNFYGTQVPGVETMQAIKMQLTQAVAMA